MGGSASSELKAAEGVIRKLQAELRAAQSVASGKEELLSRATSELAAAKKRDGERESARVDKAAYARLEEALRTTRREAEAERVKSRTAAEELRRARDELERASGDDKFRAVATREVGGETAMRAASLVAEASATLDEPVFGSLLCDFGYKRLYRADPLRLWTGTVLWERQRAFRDDRASMIAQAKKASSVGGWPGAIAVVERDASPPIVVDGQHRLGAAWALSPLPPNLREIVVEVYPPMSDKDIFALFAEINKCEPVALVDMSADDVEGGASPDDRRRIDAAAARLKDAYPDMFKPSRSCRAPHLNLDALRDQIHKACVLARLPADDASLDDFLRRSNQHLAALPRDAWHQPDLRCRANTATAIDKALDKAAKHQFFLGLTWEWLHRDFHDAP
mmetsp:Transcript_14960/g.47042  ORF Transcript_14960/g.47042 Transcript_14960/m.47042 type:complete len:395 (+) Transcript_14960:402-1586(+)|eukprot:CAMPEP_0197398480 /NCGR_PEP_ID=MMETSP1165-20131217/13461_1 /TAXON_ID=284809 /ORGANISM="Chrysocystis fragilis, Strain CCMP3189" /LENGTH=394 /DNA_ID=CAMNT_0042924433 /DNA_START=354 /DNA_END=1538 /DNA_ORIENTATION=-